MARLDKGVAGCLRLYYGKQVICEHLNIFRVPESQGLEGRIKTVTSMQICLPKKTSIPFSFRSKAKIDSKRGEFYIMRGWGRKVNEGPNNIDQTNLWPRMAVRQAGGLAVTLYLRSPAKKLQLIRIHLTFLSAFYI